MRKFGWSLFFWLAIIAASQIASTAQASWIALVIGNSTYQNVPQLDNPNNDAKLIANTLRDLGFILVGGGPQLDLDKAGLDSVIQKFGVQLRGAEVGLFFYAGHGVQVRGSNYLVPIGANPTREADVDFQMVDVNLVLRQMEGSGTKLNLVILDACRNNPFGGRGLRASGGGLAQMQAPEGTLISYATQPGNVAQDGTDGNSPYSKALAQTIKRSGLDIFGTFNAVGLAVKRSTRGSQQPWLSSSPIEGTFYFASTAPDRPATAIAPSGPTDQALPQVVSPQPPASAKPPPLTPAVAALPALKPTAAPAAPNEAKKEVPPAARNAVFPTAVSPQYSREDPGRARMHTCVDQYNANRATGGNGGMKWIEMGGGYYTECNKRLKG